MSSYHRAVCASFTISVSTWLSSCPLIISCTSKETLFPYSSSRNDTHCCRKSCRIGDGILCEPVSMKYHKHMFLQTIESTQRAATTPSPLTTRCRPIVPMALRRINVIRTKCWSTAVPTLAVAVGRWLWGNSATIPWRLHWAKSVAWTERGRRPVICCPRVTSWAATWPTSPWWRPRRSKQPPWPRLLCANESWKTTEAPPADRHASTPSSPLPLYKLRVLWMTL